MKCVFVLFVLLIRFDMYAVVTAPMRCNIYALLGRYQINDMMATVHDALLLSLCSLLLCFLEPMISSGRRCWTKFVQTNDVLPCFNKF